MEIKEFILVKNEYGHPSLKNNNTFTIPFEQIDDLDDVCGILNDMYNLDVSIVERSFVVAMNLQNKILGIMEVCKGNTHSTMPNIKEIFMFLLLCGADKFIDVHNHPATEQLTCSNNDINNANILKTEGMMLGITLEAALIITDIENINYTGLIGGVNYER